MAYINGLVANEDMFRVLAKEGMDEIHFNIATTEYLNPDFWEKIKIASKYFSRVAIEIPPIRIDQPKVIEALGSAEAFGINYLNLLDYILPEKELKSTSEPVGDFLFNHSSILQYAISSVENTEEIAEIRLHSSSIVEKVQKSFQKDTLIFALLMIMRKMQSAAYHPFLFKNCK
jgi:pyruvate formate-lyase activating enzyme-like uncharacterized protein